MNCLKAIIPDDLKRVTHYAQKYSRTAEQDIWIYYRDIGLMDTPVEQEEAPEAPSQGCILGSLFVPKIPRSKLAACFLYAEFWIYRKN